jgi:hypothetical protein
MKKLLVLAGAAVCLATGARASIIPVLDTITKDGSNFLFSYHATLSGDQGLTSGSTLVIQDFAGYVPGSISATGTGFASFILTSTPLVANFDTNAGGVQTNAVYGDDPNITDLVFTYNGPDFHTSGGPFTDIQIMGLSAESTFGGLGVDGFSSRAIKNTGLGTTGTVAFNNGAVGVPVGPGVPEPASWALLILGFGGIGGMVRLQRRKASAEPAAA